MKKQENVRKRSNKIGNEFKTLITRRGSVADLAAGVIIGAAFGAIVSSLVNDIVMPVVGVLIGGFDFATLAITVGDASINYGMFLQAVLNFAIIALCIFVFVKVINGIQVAAGARESEDNQVKKIENEQLNVLKEIRDELKRK